MKKKSFLIVALILLILQLSGDYASYLEYQSLRDPIAQDVIFFGILGVFINYFIWSLIPIILIFFQKQVEIKTSKWLMFLDFLIGMISWVIIYLFIPDLPSGLGFFWFIPAVLLMKDYCIKPRKELNFINNNETLFSPQDSNHESNSENNLSSKREHKQNRIHFFLIVIIESAIIIILLLMYFFHPLEKNYDKKQTKNNSSDTFVFYVDDNTEYHSLGGCPSINYSTKYWHIVSIETAKKKGLSPCDLCLP